MPDSLERAWRVLRTGLAFTVFGVGGLLIGLALTWAGRRADSSEAAARRGQLWIHHAYRFFEWFASSLRLIEVRFEGEERLHAPGPHFIVANHPTMLDCPLIVARLRQADCVVKSDWAANPYLQHAVRAADYLVAEEGSQMVEEGARRLREGRTLVMFPEGTRSPERGLGHFYRGAAHIALHGGCDLLPITIRVEPPSLMKGQRWWHVPESTIRFTFSVGDPISPKEPLDGSESRSVAARKITRALREYYEKRLLCGES
ncbi:MAG: lysophospholipid acyltransferase family protein [Myxococcota bacterium]|nr:lysophospholipid acyltransferase family protein [Myxococcota bacterium]